MQRSVRRIALASLVAGPMGLSPIVRPAGAQATTWSAVEQVLGRTAVAQPGGVMRFNFPRRDLHVVVGGVQVKPALALGGWVAFKSMANGDAMAMGDLVLTEGEVNRVISALQRGGIGQTALHNHLLGAAPTTMYLHVNAHGKPLDIARTLRRALETTRTPLDTAAPSPAAAFELDTAALAKALGYSGRVNGGVYQVGIPRAERVTEDGVEVPSSMGLATSLNFQPTGGGKAAITGDFVMVGSEVNEVIRALRASDIEIAALHSHLIGESPRLYFMHFWANDDALKLARGLRAAIMNTNSVKPRS
jgi:hypothetical protein